MTRKAQRVLFESFIRVARIERLQKFSTAGLVSTVLDLAKWHAALYTENLLTKSTLDGMWTNARLNNGQIASDYGLEFGLTPFRGHRRVGHIDGAEGIAATITRLIDDRITVIVLRTPTKKDLQSAIIAFENVFF